MSTDEFVIALIVALIFTVIWAKISIHMLDVKYRALDTAFRIYARRVETMDTKLTSLDMKGAR